MEREVKKVTMEELIQMMQVCGGEFIIHVEQEREDAYGGEKSVSA